jgi:hypothetical protein
MINSQPLDMPIRGMGRVGMWGAPGSGKTTFLASLSVAVNRQASNGLMLYGRDNASTEFLTRETARITQQRQFPPATATGRQLSWVMHMNTEVQARRWGLPTTVIRPYELNIDLLDQPGRMYADIPEMHGAATSARRDETAQRLFGEDDGAAGSSLAPAADEEAFLDQLAGCRGVLLLFDPLREWKEGDAFNYFHGTLMKLAQRLMPGRLRGSAKLPQYVAVCTTRFDHPDVYRRASARGYSLPSVTDPHHFPRVKDERAERFFADMVQGSQRGNADLVRSALRHFFEADRVKFFVTSAIGFHLDRSVGRFQESDFSNVEDPGGNPRIRGPIYPINVIEPLMWLGQRLAMEEANHAR